MTPQMQAAARAATPPRELRYDAAVPRALVHRAAVAEVFPTDAEALGGDRFLVAAQLPRTHAFFNDAVLPYYDVLVVMETARQAGVLIAHRYYGVPIDFAFVLDAVDFTVGDAEASRIGAVPGRLLLDVQISEQTYRRGTLATLRFEVDVTIDGVSYTRGCGSMLFLPRATYRRLRAQARVRSAGGLVPVPDAAVDPAAVGRRDARNVVLASPRRGDAPGSIVSDLIVDQGHPCLFDHPLDHVPGMLLMEACRQGALIAATQASGRPPEALVTGCAMRFESFAELDAVTRCVATPGVVVERPDKRVAVPVDVRLEQDGWTVASARLEVTL
jgi:hypothetical protein